MERIDATTLALVDSGIRFDVFDAQLSTYRVEVLDDEGDTLARIAVAGREGRVVVPWRPPGTVPDYLVVRIHVVRSGREASRPIQIHLRTDGKPRVVGIRR